MKDVTSTSFGYLIAFLLPGIFGLYALSVWFPQIATLLQPIVTANTSVGPSFLFLVVAVGMGVCVSGLRYFIFEKAVFRKGAPPPGTYHGMSGDELTLHKSIVDEHYRYHQFYGGCAVALLILFIGWLVHSDSTWSQIIWWTLGFVGFEALLSASACDSFTKYDKCRNERRENNKEKMRAAK
jgi:hypothetical protein